MQIYSVCKLKDQIVVFQFNGHCHFFYCLDPKRDLTREKVVVSDDGSNCQWSSILHYGKIEFGCFYCTLLLCQGSCSLAYSFSNQEKTLAHFFCSLEVQTWQVALAFVALAGNTRGCHCTRCIVISCLF